MCGDHARVETEQVQATVEAGMLELDAAVHDHRETLALAGDRRILVADAELHPDGLSADGEDVLDD